MKAYVYMIGAFLLMWGCAENPLHIHRNGRIVREMNGYACLYKEVSGSSLRLPSNKEIVMVLFEVDRRSGVFAFSVEKKESCLRVKLTALIFESAMFGEDHQTRERFQKRMEWELDAEIHVAKGEQVSASPGQAFEKIITIPLKFSLKSTSVPIDFGAFRVDD